MNVTPDNTFADPEQLIADLQRQLSECKAERDEGLQRETAAAEVLQVINSSPGNLAPIFDAILEKALRVCSATFGMMHSHDNGRLTRVAARGLPAAYNNWRLEHPLEIPSIGYPPMLQRLLAGEAVVDQPDFMAGEVYRQGNPHARALGELGGARSAVSVALRNDDALHGTIIIFRQEVRPFSDKEIRLLQNFAAQAVIAMENARLLSELRQSLEQQTATANVLRTISTSPGELGPVFNTMLDNATRLCEAHFGILYRYEEEAFRAVALRDAPPPFAEFQQRARIHPTPASGLGRIMSTLQPVHIIDTMAEQRYIDGDPYAVTAVKLSGSRTLIFVPMLKEDALVGAIAIYRREVRPFTDKQIELLSSFAAQAVIAIENARLLNELRQRTDDLTESLEQQTATSEVLKIISSSPGQLEPVFQTMLANATHLCEAKFASLRLSEGDRFRFVSLYNAPPALAEHWRGMPLVQPDPESATGRVVLTKQAAQIDDVRTSPAYRKQDPLSVAGADLGGYRTVLAVPMLKDSVLIGVITIYHQDVRRFTEKQIKLVSNFADQAVIAIENTRLLNELRESLQQQTATSEVLSVISSSPGELEPVFQAVLENAVRICEAKFGVLLRFDGDAFHYAAQVGTPPEYAEYQSRRGPFQPIPGGQLDRVMRTKHVSRSDDNAAETVRSSAFTLGGARSRIVVPMLKDDMLIGAIVIYRQEVRPFSDKQIALLKSFAAQAVIAIENARLLNELRQSLEQQTATADVLKVISRSTFDLKTVLNTLVESAAELCEADMGHIGRPTADGTLQTAANYGMSAAMSDALARAPIKADRTSVTGRALVERKTVQIIDAATDPEYALPAVQSIGEYHSMLGVPLMREGNVIGVFALARKTVRPFTEKHIELVTTFADQAVIAIENARLFDEVRQRTDDLSESLEQQTATSEVLKVISSSPGELEPVFKAMLENATRICEAKFGILYRYNGQVLDFAAEVGTPSEFAEYLRRRGSFYPTPASLLDQVVRTKQVRHTADDTIEAAPGRPARLGGARSRVCVPMLKDDVLVGVISIYRQEVRPFSNKQIDLLKNFAAQAVIAIENARLLNELRQRTDDLSESLEQQTATSEVLRVISGSPGALAPVFEIVLQKAVTICEAKFGTLTLSEGDYNFRVVATHNAPPAFADLRLREPGIKRGPETAMGRVFETKRVVQITDIAADNSAAPTHAQIAGARTLVIVPMLKDEELVGGIAIYRQEVRPFTDKQIELLQNFAAQAVIAIENTRLLNELRESLQQQMATAQVLSVISSSPGQLAPVFQSMLENATRICEAKFGTLFRFDGEKFHLGAQHGTPAELVEFQRRRGAFTPPPGILLDVVMRTKRLCHIADYAAEPVAGVATTLGGARSIVAVPMLKDEELIGAIVIYRQEVRPFTDKQIALVENFAAQAVIAIENTRLLNELRESLERQTATADVLKVISRSTFDLQTVLDTLVQSAATLCDAEIANIWRPEDGVYRLAAGYGVASQHKQALENQEYLKTVSVEPGPGSIVGRTLLSGEPVQVRDLQADADYTLTPIIELGGYRAMLGVPLLREGAPIGVLVLARTRAELFTEKQIELVTTFADQAVIAIENARLFEAEQQRTRELARSLDDLRTAQDRLVQTQKLASLGQLTAGIAHEIKNPLNFVNNFSGVSVELIEELQETLRRVTADDKTRGEIGELADTLRNNLDKIVQHGRRADAIVKNMLLHSREGSGEHRPVDINALVEESLNLAYHGARAEKQGFNITLERSFDPTAGEADVYPQEISRVLINLISNGFYAAGKRREQTAGDGYEATLTAATRSLGDRVEITIRDNGTGIPPEVRKMLFNPFFTTKPAGEGTGLGLSISHDIIVKQHGGSIEVETRPGEFTEFRIVLPRKAA